MSAYSNTKALRHLDVIRGMQARHPTRPVHVQVILSDLCNQACNFCAYRDPTYSSSQLFRVLEPGKKGLRKEGFEQYNFNPNRQMPREKALEILEDCREMGVEGVQFTGGGEPTVHPDFREILVEAQVMGLATAVVTNGVLVERRDLADAMACCSWVRISLDAGTDETYARTRNVFAGELQRAIDGITAIRRERDANETDCVIGVGFVVTPSNYAEVVEATRLAREAGADNIRIGAQFSSEDERLFTGIHEKASVMCRLAEELTDDSFTVYNRFGEKLSDLQLKSPDYETCGYQYFTTYIGADLNVYRCCVLAYNERGIVGSLKDRRFKDLWLSAERAEGMQSFDARDCERCQFNGQNRLLDAVLTPQLHEEFV